MKRLTKLCSNPTYKHIRRSKSVVLKSPVWRPTLSLSQVGVKRHFPHNLPSCGWMWLLSAKGQHFFCIGLQLRCFVFERRPQQQYQHFSFVSNKAFEGHKENIQKCQRRCGIKFVWQSLISLETFVVGFFNHRFGARCWVMHANTAVATQWPPKLASQLKGGSFGFWGPCGSMVLYTL